MQHKNSTRVTTVRKSFKSWEWMCDMYLVKIVMLAVSEYSRVTK